MYTSIQLLDMVKARYCLPSDYALANKIDVSRSFISSIRAHRKNLGFDNSLKCAELLELDPWKVISSAGYEMSKSKNMHSIAKLWEQYV